MCAKISYKMDGFGRRLEQLILSRYESNAEFANRIGVDRSQVKRWIDGTSSPRAECLLLIAKEFECDCHYLLTGSSAGYALINHKIGLDDNAIDNLSNLQFCENRYVPVCDLRTSEVLSIALSDEDFICTLADYLTCPDVDLYASGCIMNQPANLKNSTNVIGINTYCIDVNERKVPLKPILRIEFENILERVRIKIQDEMHNRLLKMSEREEKGVFKGTGYKIISTPLPNIRVKKSEDKKEDI